MAGNLIKGENLKVLRRVRRKEKEATKPQLAEKTGLSGRMPDVRKERVIACAPSISRL